jgi:exopolysaccharide biosynthesis polyprenyl glycosylphosphotransferase
MTRPLALGHELARFGHPPTQRIVRRRGWLVRRMLLAADLVGLVVAFVLAELAFGAGDGSTNRLGLEAEALAFGASLPCWVALAKVYGLYDRDEERTDHSTSDDVVRVFHLVTVCTWLLVGAEILSGRGVDRRVVFFWAAAVLLVVAARVGARAIARRTSTYVQKAVVVGTDDVAELIGRKLLQHPEYGIDLVGFVGSARGEGRSETSHVPRLGLVEQLPELVSAYGIERVVVAFPEDGDGDLRAAVRELRQHDVQVDLVPRMFDLVGPRVDVHDVEGIPLLGLAPARPSRSSRLLKRALDVGVAATALVLTAPLFAYVGWRIRRDSPGPVFFRQTRLGLNMREFTVLKFRTMTDGQHDAEHEAHIAALMDSNASPSRNGLYKLDRGDRVTPVGRWLRKTSLDELPQLVNVLRGDMSLVGPRPCIPYETEHFAPHHFDRFLVPAGITGLWQVKARAHCTFGEALDLDVAYANGWSLGLDLRLLLRTPFQLLHPRHTA